MELKDTIDAASERLTPLKTNMENPGPGGQAYNLAPTPLLTDQSLSEKTLGLLNLPYRPTAIGIAVSALAIGLVAGIFVTRVWDARDQS